jgi:CBS domain-containing protein
MTRAADKISELMISDVVTFGPDSLVSDAIEAMVERNIGCVVVVKEQQPVGIFTERDALRGLLAAFPSGVG